MTMTFSYHILLTVTVNTRESTVPVEGKAKYHPSSLHSNVLIDNTVTV